MLDWDSRRRIADDISQVAGFTPLVWLRNVVEGPAAVCGKLEFMNPSASLKDRILRHMVGRAEERGDLRRGMTILEASTGSTGIATAMIGAARGYPVVIVMPEGMSEESSGPHHQDSGEAKIRESTAGVSRKPSSDGKARGCSSKQLSGLTAWNT